MPSLSSECQSSYITRSSQHTPGPALPEETTLALSPYNPDRMTRQQPKRPAQERAQRPTESILERIKQSNPQELEKLREGMLQRIRELINPTAYAAINEKLSNAIKYLILGIVRLERMNYNRVSNNVLLPQCCKHSGAWTSLLRRLAVDSVSHNADSIKKQCSTCQSVLPATAEYFHRDKHQRDGLTQCCKVCRTAKSNAYNQEHRDEKRDYNKQYYAEHQNKEKERCAKYSSIKENRDRKNKATKRWYYKDIERSRENARQYFQTERGRIASRANSHNRRALKRNNGGKHTLAQLQELYQSQGGQCFYCKGDLKAGWHADHYIPLSKGGSNDISNIVIACELCNRQKHDKLPDEWSGNKRLNG